MNPVISFPDDVTLETDALVDNARQIRCALNPMAHRILAGVTAGHPLGAVVADIAQQTGAPTEVVAADASQLIAALQQRHLINLAMPTTSISDVRAAALRYAGTALAGQLQPDRAATRRHALDATGSLSLLGSIAWGARSPLANITVAAGVPVCGLLGVAAGVRGVLAGLLIVVGVVLSIVLHEFAHAVVAARHGSRPFMVVGRARLAIVTPNNRAPRSTALAGPAVPTTLGLIGLELACSTPGAVSNAVALLALPFVLHAANLTALTTDGRTLMTRRPLGAPNTTGFVGSN